jgi:predicted anti-sigma-YlaC factor YlaD
VKKKQTICSKVIEHLCDQLEEDLHSAKCREIKEHLKKCPNCSAYLDSLKKTVRFYTDNPNPRFRSKSRRKVFAVPALKG